MYRVKNLIIQVDQLEYYSLMQEELHLRSMLHRQNQ